MPSGPLAIIILNYQGAKDTAACLTTLAPALDRALAEGHGPFYTLVIDNDSDTDDVMALADYLTHDFPWVTFIPNSENVGFSRAVNQGIRWAVDQRVESVLLLNNDTLLEPDTLTRLCDQAKSDRLLTPLILQYPATELIWSCGGQITWGAVPGHLTRLGQPLARLPERLRTAEVIPTGFCSGCCLLIPLPVLRTIGLFDETYFAYVEDVDFSLRATAHGIGRCVVPGAILYHRSGQATGGGYSVRGRYLIGFGTAVCVRQHATRTQALKTHLLMRLSILIASLRERGGPNAEAPLAKWRGYRDGLKVELRRPPTLRTHDAGAASPRAAPYSPIPPTTP